VPDRKLPSASNSAAFNSFLETKIFQCQRVVPFFFRNHGPMPGFGQNLRARIALEFEEIVIKKIPNRVDRFAPKTLIREIRKCPRFDEGR